MSSRLKNLTPVVEGQTGDAHPAFKHGLNSDDHIRPIARAHRRRVLRRIGLSPRDLDAIGRGYLDAYVKLTAKIQAIDDYIDAHGLIRGDGEPQPVLKLYVSLQNSARLALARLEEHVRVRRVDPQERLRQHLELKHGGRV